MRVAGRRIRQVIFGDRPRLGIELADIPFEARREPDVSILIGSQSMRTLIGPLMIYHPIPAASVARALVNLSFRDEPGVFIQQY
jgi:hypothetical protein